MDEVSAEGEVELSDLEELLAQHIQYAGLPTPEREYRFAPPRRFRADFAYPDKMLLIEVEGGVWTQGRHSRGAGYSKDVEKYNLATVNGWHLLRFTGDMIKSGMAVSTIEQMLKVLENIKRGAE